ncbi:MAG: hypothetical protein ACERKN_10040 [Velocimicrobium sp.]
MKFLKKIFVYIKKMCVEVKYVLLNCIVCNIPFWPFRYILYSAFGMKIGRKSRILMHTRVYAPEKIKIGKNTFVNECCYLDGRGGIDIGSSVTIATYTKLITGSHNIDDENFSYIESPIVIGDNVAIFSDSLVLGGSVIEKGCVFSARSLVRKGVYEEKGIYAGNPVKFLRIRKSLVEYEQQGFTVFR